MGGLYSVWHSALLKEKLLLYGSEEQEIVGLQWSSLDEARTGYCTPLGSRMGSITKASRTSVTEV